jgi:hypothetical protein
VIAIGGVSDIKEELGKVHGKRPYFEQQPVLFSPVNKDHDTGKPKPIHSDSPHSTKWSHLWKLIDKHGSHQLPWIEDALQKNEVQERIFDKM